MEQTEPLVPTTTPVSLVGVAVSVGRSATPDLTTGPLTMASPKNPLTRPARVWSLTARFAHRQGFSWAWRVMSRGSQIKSGMTRGAIWRFVGARASELERSASELPEVFRPDRKSRTLSPRRPCSPEGASSYRLDSTPSRLGGCPTRVAASSMSRLKRCAVETFSKTSFQR